jgi:hypothetical protein
MVKRVALSSSFIGIVAILILAYTQNTAPISIDRGGIAIAVALYGLCDLDVGYFLDGGFAVASVG